MATTKAAAAPATVDVAKQLKSAVGVFSKTQKESAAKDKTIAKLQAKITKLEAKTSGGVAPAVKRGGRKAASADDADAPVAKRVKATAAAPAATKGGKTKPVVTPVATEPKKRGPKPKAAAPAPVAAEPKKRGPKKAVEAAAAPAPKKSRSKSEEDFLV